MIQARPHSRVQCSKTELQQAAIAAARGAAAQLSLASLPRKMPLQTRSRQLLVDARRLLMNVLGEGRWRRDGFGFVARH
jgi:hypothetical protein